MPNRPALNSRPAAITVGAFRVMHDVRVEDIRPETIVITAQTALVDGEDLVLELPRERGYRSLVPVTVTSTAAVWLDGEWRHRLVLAPLQPVQCSAGGADQTARGAHPAMGLLVRRVPVRARELRDGGCQLDTSDRLPEGSIGLLELPADGRHRTEVVRVAGSVQTSAQRWGWRADAHFLAVDASEATAVRNVLAQFEIIDEVRMLPAPLARVYGRNGAGADGSAEAPEPGALDGWQAPDAVSA